MYGVCAAYRPVRMERRRAVGETACSRSSAVRRSARRGPPGAPVHRVTSPVRRERRACAPGEEGLCAGRGEPVRRERRACAGRRDGAGLCAHPRRCARRGLPVRRLRTGAAGGAMLRSADGGQSVRLRLRRAQKGSADGVCGQGQAIIFAVAGPNESMAPSADAVRGGSARRIGWPGSSALCSAERRHTAHPPCAQSLCTVCTRRGEPMGGVGSVPACSYTGRPCLHTRGRARQLSALLAPFTGAFYWQKGASFIRAFISKPHCTAGRKTGLRQTNR